MAGVTAEGFVKKTLEETNEEIAEALRGEYGDSVDLTTNEPLGQAKDIWSEREAEVWDLAQAVYESFDRDAATGAALRALCALTGTVARAAYSSTVTATCTGTPGTPLPAGREASVEDTGTRFISLTDATIVIQAAWAASTAYAVGDRVRNGGTQRIYECITAGTSAGSGGPTTTDDDITDNTVHWCYVGDGQGAVDVEMESFEVGPKVASAGTLTVIDTAVGGWNSVRNMLDAELGALDESDAALRVRQRAELRGSGLSAVEAMQAVILRVDGVTACTVFENTTMSTDGDGVPAKAVEALVQGGDDANVRAAVFESKPAGIQAYGTDTDTHVDSQGVSHSIGFSRPTEVPIYVVMTLVVDPNEYPEDGDEQVEEAIAVYGQTVAAGKNVVASKIEAVAHTIDGVLEATAYIGTAPAPATRTTVAINTRQLADYDTSRITVNTSEGTP